MSLMDWIQDIVEEEYDIEAHYTMIRSYLQATSFCQGGSRCHKINGSCTHQWFSKFEEALTLET